MKHQICLDQKELLLAVQVYLGTKGYGAETYEMQICYQQGRLDARGEPCEPPRFSVKAVVTPIPGRAA